MRLQTLFIVFFLLNGDVFGQLEITTGYAVNKNLADGVPIQFAYDLKIRDRIYTKPQIGYKYLYHFNDFVGATLTVNIIELHQTISYEMIKKKIYSKAKYWTKLSILSLERANETTLQYFATKSI